jgi:hypothetical protein
VELEFEVFDSIHHVPYYNLIKMMKQKSSKPEIISEVFSASCISSIVTSEDINCPMNLLPYLSVNFITLSTEERDMLFSLSVDQIKNIDNKTIILLMRNACRYVSNHNEWMNEDDMMSLYIFIEKVNPMNYN